MESSIRRRRVSSYKLTNQQRREFNIEQREKFPSDPLPYLPVKCSAEGCRFHFIPIDNAYNTICPLHKHKNSKIHPCPFMNHELVDTSFFTWGIDEDLPTDFNHANYTPVR